MKRRFVIRLVVLLSLLAVSPSVAVAYYPVITAENLQEWMAGKKKVVLIDTRLPEEYRDGHIPGAINVPGERMYAEKAKLPRDKSTPLIFYCRGVG